MPWFAWLLLGLVVTLILVVVARMLCASWRGREEEEKKRQKREESRQRKLERELRKHEERENKNTEHETQVNITEYDSTGHNEPHVQYQEHQLDSDGGVGEAVHGQARDSSSVLFASYPHSAQPPVHFAQFRNMDRSSIYV